MTTTYNTPKVRTYQAKEPTPAGARHCDRCTILIFHFVPDGWDARIHQAQGGHCPECAEMLEEANEL